MGEDALLLPHVGSPVHAQLCQGWSDKGSVMATQLTVDPTHTPAVSIRGDVIQGGLEQHCGPYFSFYAL